MIVGSDCRRANRELRAAVTIYRRVARRDERGQRASARLRDRRPVDESTRCVHGNALPEAAGRCSCVHASCSPPSPMNGGAPKPGSISIDSTPFATIFIDGKRADVTPLLNRSLSAGRHKVKAVLADGERSVSRINLPARLRARNVGPTGCFPSHRERVSFTAERPRGSASSRSARSSASFGDNNVSAASR